MTGTKSGGTELSENLPNFLGYVFICDFTFCRTFFSLIVIQLMKAVIDIIGSD